MGCDIHPCVEVRGSDGAWRPVGEVFDSTYDFDFIPATRERLEKLTDGQLVDGAAFQVVEREDDADRQPGKYLREKLGPELVAIFAAMREQQEADKLAEKQALDGARAKVTGARRGFSWENEEDEEAWRAAHDEVKALERQFLRQRRDRVTLTAEQREAVIDALSTFRYDYGDDADEEDTRLSLSLHRAEGDPPFKTDKPWEGRNYDLFAILADVRNGRGFAGIPTGAGFVPISMPRGIPDDAHPETVRAMERYGVDGHSHTFHTLKDLREYDWDGQATTIYGVVPAEAYEALKAKGKDRPHSYSGGISGRGCVTFTAEGYEAWKAAGRPSLNRSNGGVTGGIFGPGDLREIIAPERPGGEEATVTGDVYGHEDEPQPVAAYVHMAWRETYREAAGTQFMERTIPALEALIPEGGTDEDVRLCMFFDN